MHIIIYSYLLATPTLFKCCYILLVSLVYYVLNNIYFRSIMDKVYLYKIWVYFFRIQNFFYKIFLKAIQEVNIHIIIFYWNIIKLILKFLILWGHNIFFKTYLWFFITLLASSVFWFIIFYENFSYFINILYMIKVKASCV